jgi:cell division protein ZapA
VGQVTVRVNGYQHTIGCKDGEEQHVGELIAQIEDKVRLIRAMGGQFSEARMLLHVALLLADECGDLRTEATRLRAGAPAAAPAADPLLAERLGRIAERIEGLAQTLDRS